MEDIAMKKFLKSKQTAGSRNAAQTRQDAAKVRCYVCINGVVMPVL